MWETINVSYTLVIINIGNICIACLQCLLTIHCFTTCCTFVVTKELIDPFSFVCELQWTWWKRIQLLSFEMQKSKCSRDQWGLRWINGAEWRSQTRLISPLRRTTTYLCWSSNSWLSFKVNLRKIYAKIHNLDYQKTNFDLFLCFFFWWLTALGLFCLPSSFNSWTSSAATFL